MTARPTTPIAAEHAPSTTIGTTTALYVRVFTILWAIAHIAHMLRKGDAERPLTWLVLLAALLVIDRPTSRWRLAALAVTMPLYAADLLPQIDNHVVIMCAVDLGLLVAVLTSLRRRGTREDAAPPLSALPYARLVFVIAYGAAAIAKLNDGFFDTTHSCAVELFDESLSMFGDGGSRFADALAPALPYAVAAFELAIPVLLLIPATRLFGVVTVVAFHVAMSFSPTSRAGIGFTFVLFGLTYLFLPERSGFQVTRRVRMVARRVGLARGWNRTVVLVVVAIVIGVLTTREVVTFATVEGNGNFLVRLPLMIVIGVLLLDSAWQAWQRRWPRRLDFRPRHVAYYVLLALVVLNAASPYLGGKTITSFTMYSNLRTEEDSSNHFFLPRLPLASGQDDLVEIVASSDPRLRRLREQEEDELITWHELRRRLSAVPTASITYLRGGSLFQYAEARENPELVELDPLARRLLAYRLVDRAGAPVRCRW